MIKATSVQLTGSADVLAYLFQSNGTHWVRLRSSSDVAGCGWLECWSSKEGTRLDLSAALESVRAIVADNLRSGPLGPYLEGAHFILDGTLGAVRSPVSIAQFRPAEVAASSDGSHWSSSIPESAGIICRRIVYVNLEALLAILRGPRWRAGT